MLEVRNLSKRFGSFEALASVDLRVRPGEIHGLAGVNGSGKTTLLGSIFGDPVIAATGGYRGEVVLDGKTEVIRNPAQAISLGIGMIHQDLALIPGMSVAANIMIRRENTVKATRLMFGHSLALVDEKANRMQASGTLRNLGADLDPAMDVMNLSVSMKQFVEIAREIDRQDLKVLLLDEPTSALHQHEAGQLFDALKILAEKGTALIYVSHRLDEIISLCHRLTVLKDGKVAGRFDPHEFSLDAISECMTGRSVARVQKRTPAAAGRPVITLQGFSVDMPGEPLRDLDLEILQGEILGLAGLSGQGRPAVGYGIMGMYQPRGKVFVGEELVERPDPQSMISRGIFMLPEDRRGAGLLADHSVMENIVFSARQNRSAFLKRFPLSSLQLPDSRSARAYAQECIRRFHISCRGIRQKMKELSGGNQQKVCIARALAMDPAVLFVSEPTRGVDIAARETLLNILLTINLERGTTLVVSSSEIDELMRICDRIAVLYEGKVFAVMDPGCSDASIALACFGERGANR